MAERALLLGAEARDCHARSRVLRVRLELDAYALPLLERVAQQTTDNFFNLFNIVNMGLPANILTGSGFGEISKTAGTSRQIQLSLKVIY